MDSEKENLEKLLEKNKLLEERLKQIGLEVLNLQDADLICRYFNDFENFISRYEQKDNIFENHPNNVAEMLCGRKISNENGEEYIFAEVSGYDGSNISRRILDFYQATPGTIGIYCTRGEKITIVSAHSKTDEGIIAIHGLMNKKGNPLNMSETTLVLGTESLTGKNISDSNLKVSIQKQNQIVNDLKLAKKRKSSSAYVLQ